MAKKKKENQKQTLIISLDKLRDIVGECDNVLDDSSYWDSEFQPSVFDKDHIVIITRDAYNDSVTATIDVQTEGVASINLDI